ncbi:MAG: 30S ribosomal protein S9 [Planctomycetota bacterium]|nr:30S ribosomal protein S9 [Planctomycetota bacterium]MDA1114637.1 30S ribosomal protein S9 [Planctomycetota bacterium]
MVDLTPNTYHWGTGRRKNAVARVRVRPGSGQFTVNGKTLAEYFPRGVDQSACQSPMVSLAVQKKVDVFVNAHGGGNTGQAGAVRMGLSRALLALYPDAHAVLAEASHFTRDPRMVERKKYGRHGARRGHQWGKR